MMAKTRFLNSIIKSAKAQEVSMPWSRGPARRALIAHRHSQHNTATVAAKRA